MHGLLITASESGGVDNPHAQPGAPLTLEHAFFLELRDDALSASLRAAEVPRELSLRKSSARARSASAALTGRAYGSMASLIASSMNSTKSSHKPAAPERAKAS